MKDPRDILKFEEISRIKVVNIAWRFDDNQRLIISSFDLRSRYISAGLG